jgi:hypothetical protein
VLECVWDMEDGMEWDEVEEIKLETEVEEE